MADDLTPPFHWALVAGTLAEPLFDAPRVTELVLAVGAPSDAGERVEGAAFQLSEIAKAFAFDLWREVQPSSDKEGTAALRVAAACEAVLRLTGVGTDAEPSPDALLPSFGPGGLFAAANLRGEPSGKVATMDELRAVYLLRLDALKMAEIRAKRSAMKPAKAGRKRSAALKRLVASLSAFYFDVWGDVPTVSRSKAKASVGAVSGRFVRLLSEVNKALQATGLRYYATDESLVQHWRSLDPDERLRFDMVKNPERSA